MRKLLAFILAIPAIAFGAATPVDNIVHWDGTNQGVIFDLVTATNAMITNTAAGKGRWDSQTTTTSSYISNGVAPFKNGVVVCNGTNYFGSFSNVMSTAFVNPTQYVTWRWTTAFSKASIFFTFKISGLGTTFGDYDSFTMDGQGDFIALTIKDNIGLTGYKAGLETGTFQAGASIPITNDTWYGASLDFANGGTAHINLYETVGWTVIGTTNGTFTAVNCDRFEIGRRDAHQLFPSGMVVQIGDIAIDIANATFPLLPAAITVPSISSQPSAWTNVSGLQFYLLSTVAGDTPLSYQWRKNTNNLAGAAAALVNYTNALPYVSDSGWYDLIVTNRGGSITSNPVYVSITNPPATSVSGALTISGAFTLH